MLLVWHRLISGRSKAITKKRIAILMKETKKKDVIIVINTRTRKYKFSPFNQRRQELALEVGKSALGTRLPRPLLFIHILYPKAVFVVSRKAMRYLASVRIS